MLYSQDRNKMREMYYLAWDKYQTKQTLEPIEGLLVKAILLHPEYHTILKNIDKNIDTDYSSTDIHTNPFLHMGFHVAIFEQLDADHPQGIAAHYQQLLNTHKDEHRVQHMFIDCLLNMLATMQQNNGQPDDAAYLQCISALI